jgi:hypothetical protein
VKFRDRSIAACFSRSSKPFEERGRARGEWEGEEEEEEERETPPPADNYIRE